MSSFPKRPKPLHIDELRRIILEAIDSGMYSGYQETMHARFDNVDRGIDLNDVLFGLRSPNWSLKKKPEFSDEFWQWKYTVLTTNVEGESIGIVVAVDPKNRSFEVLTRWRE